MVQKYFWRLRKLFPRSRNNSLRREILWKSRNILKNRENFFIGQTIFFNGWEFFGRLRINFVDQEFFFPIENFFVDWEISCRSRNFFVDREISCRSRNFLLIEKLPVNREFFRKSTNWKAYSDIRQEKVLSGTTSRNGRCSFERIDRVSNLPTQVKLLYNFNLKRLVSNWYSYWLLCNLSVKFGYQNFTDTGYAWRPLREINFENRKSPTRFFRLVS